MKNFPKKTNTILYWSFDFTQEFEDCDLLQPTKADKKDAIKVLRKILSNKTDEELVEHLEVPGWEKEEIDCEPDWDTLPGGKDWD